MTDRSTIARAVSSVLLRPFLVFVGIVGVLQLAGGWVMGLVAGGSLWQGFCGVVVVPLAIVGAFWIVSSQPKLFAWSLYRLMIDAIALGGTSLLLACATAVLGWGPFDEVSLPFIQLGLVMEAVAVATWGMWLAINVLLDADRPDEGDAV